MKMPCHAMKTYTSILQTRTQANLQQHAVTASLTGAVKAFEMIPRTIFRMTCQGLTACSQTLTLYTNTVQVWINIPWSSLQTAQETGQLHGGGSEMWVLSTVSYYQD